jgi:uncharacterized protein YjbJ (UPF0337 family)
MSFTDSLKTTAMSFSGRVKEIVGVVFKQRDLQVRGQNQQVAANLRRARAKAEGAAKSVRKAFDI